MTNEPDPEPLPEDDPRRIEWVKRIMSFSLNDRGTPRTRDWQTPRTTPDYDKPFVERGKQR